VPARIIAELIGAPPEDWEQFREWSDAAVGSLDPDVEMSGVEASMALYAYFGNLIAERGVEYRNDLVSTLLQSEIEGERLTPDALLSFLWLLLVAGNETTRNLIALGTLALIAHPDQKALLLDDMALLPLAIEEMLRWITPVTHMTRVATEDVEIRGQLIKQGDRVLMLYGSANRDEEVFGDDAEDFKITRTPNPHLSFGTGEHSCLGLSLARLEARVFFEELLPKYPQMDLIGKVIRMRATMTPGVRLATVKFNR
jgi:cytochrome P450